MKFGKRLIAESNRRWRQSYIDYRQLKEAIKRDVAAQDARGTRFEHALKVELQKVAAFCVEKEEELAAAMGRLSLSSSPQEVAALRAELRHLSKYVSLNYIAVVKAVKKRNRHVRAACGADRVAPLRAVPILSASPWFTSTRLAELATQAEVLARELAPSRAAPDEVLAEYQCPICLDVLRSPVVLTCAHRFCWGCLLAQCTAVKSRAARSDWAPPAKDGKQQESTESAGGATATAVLPQQQTQQVQQAAATQPEVAQQDTTRQQAVWEAEPADEDEVAAVKCSFKCAVCRKAQALNLDRLQVDPHLDAFLHKLERQQQRHTSSSSSPIRISATSAAAAAAESATESMLLDTKPPSASTTSLAEASELAEVAQQDDDVAEDQEARQPAAATVGAAPQHRTEIIVGSPAGVADEVPLLPPQRPEHQGRLVVCLDLDGTLVTTFTPKRAPLLPPSAVSYVVGRGGKLNPGGVFVVERPGLGEFLRRIAPFSEVVLFTAGLEDYAAPICDEIEARYGPFHHRLYRPATVASEHYPCIKDLSRLGRDLKRCVLVDDTPLAFFQQPDHGIPVLQFRGDVDDRMLTEAVVPLLESLHACPDVAASLARRFNMQKWFQAQGLVPQPQTALQRQGSLPQIKLPSPHGAAPAAPAPAPCALRSDASSAEVLAQRGGAGTLLVFDFDQTLTPWDAGERLCDELAPELTSLLSSLQMPANFVPVTNTVLAEMQRRGVSRDRLVTCLREMGREVPLPIVRMLRWASARGLPSVILSDCNSTFITHILTGAKCLDTVRHVITNQATFRRVAAAPEQGDASATPAAARPASGAFGGSWGLFRGAGMRPAGGAGSGKPPLPGSSSTTGCSHRLVVEPCHDESSHGSHGCRLCPANLCKGQQLAALRASAPYQRIVYCGDGANDICPSLHLGPQDVVLARAGHALERLIAERAAAPGARAVAAAVHVWQDHADLARLVQLHAC